MAGLSIWHVLIFAIVVILAMQSVLNLTNERVDELWEYASKL